MFGLDFVQIVFLFLYKNVEEVGLNFPKTEYDVVFWALNIVSTKSILNALANQYQLYRKSKN